MRKMNNRYICRGKQEDNGEWVAGYYVFRRKRSGVFGQVISELDHDRHLIIDVWGHSHEVIPETVGQCTNKTDCKGKFIFSGDLLRFTDSDGEHSIYKVYYSDNYAGWAIQEADCNGVDNMADWEISREYFEVIGNIHDNPELLEVER